MSENQSYQMFVPESHINCSLDNFDWSELKNLKTIVEDVVNGKRTKGLVLIGDPGLGKTHILVGLFRALLDKGVLLGSGILYLEFQKFVNETVENMKTGLLPEKVIEDLTAKVIILDDIRPCWSGRIWSDMLKRIIERAYEDSLTLFMSTNAGSVEDLIKHWNIEDYWLSRLYAVTDIVKMKGMDRRMEC